MLENIKEKITLKNRKIKFKKTIIFVIIAVVAVGGFFTYKGLFGTKAAETLTTANVTRGDISVSITGSGTIEPNEQFDITSLVKGDITAAPFEEGQTVKKGDLLYRIDPKDIENSIEKQKISLEQSKLTYNKGVEEQDKLTIKAKSSGTITNLYVKVGDSVSDKTKIADIVDSNTMILRVPFLPSDADQISVGSAASVIMGDTYESLGGTVQRIPSGVENHNGINVKYIEISVDNKGSILKGSRATAVVGNVACNDFGDFDYNSTSTISSETAGEISSLYCHQGDYVQNGTVVARLTSDTSNTTNQQNALSLKNAQLSLQSSYDQLGNYNITSPIDGTIVQKTTKQGDTLDNTNTKVIMAVVADMSKIVFKMNVDELDIAKLKLEQEVKITADALPGKNFTGYIDNISVVGTTTNGVTTYPVTVVVNNPEGLISGMNVDAEVVVESKTDVLRVPVSAVNRGNFVTVKSADGASDEKGKSNMGNKGATSSDNSSEGSQSQQGGQNGGQNKQGAGNQKQGQSGQNFKLKIPDGYKMAKVETGLSDNNFIEITNGLKEGDTVLLPTPKASTSQGNMMMAPGGGNFGGGYGGGGQVYRQNGGYNTTRSSAGSTSSSTRSSTGGASR